MSVPPGWAMLEDCGAAKSLTGADPSALLTQAREKRGRKAGDARKVEAVEEKHHFRRIGEQVITSLIKLQVPGVLGGQIVYYAPSITSGSTPPVVGNDRLLPWCLSIHLYLGECPLEIPSRGI